jgi:hypothetical protein
MGWGLLAGLIEPVTGYFKDRQTIKAATKERGDELKKINLEAKLAGIKASDQNILDMDANARGLAGYMDDISFYLFLLPLPLVFIPSMQVHVMAGFAALELMPVWYQVALGLMLAAVWGYRKIVQPLILKFLGKKL